MPARGGPRKQLRGYDDPWDALRSELDRSRRYRHPLALVRMVGDESSGHRTLTARARREGRSGRRNVAPEDLLAQIRGLLRSGDSAWCHGGAVYALLPETDAGAAAAMIARLRAVLPAVASARDVRLAAFPEHGLTVKALRAAVAPPREGRLAPAGDREWRVLSERLPGRTAPPGDPMPEGAD